MTQATEIFIAEPALENLLQYHHDSDSNAQRVHATLEGLRSRGLQSRVLKLSDVSRPIWHQEIDAQHSLYFTLGKGPRGREARIAFFGPPLPETSASLRDLLYFSGELPYHALPAEVTLEDERQVPGFPAAPERRIAPEATLDSYIHPSPADLPGNDRAPSEGWDALNHRPFRLLRSIRPPMELPVRLHPQQGRVLHEKRPLFVQGVAGSGKTTILAHFAHQELIRAENEASILILAYTEALKSFIEKLMVALGEVESIDISKISIYTWQGLCDYLSEAIDAPPFHWAQEHVLSNYLQFRVRSLSKTYNYSNLGPELQEFIRAALKGDVTDSYEPLIRRKDFLKLDETPMDKFLDRREIYEIAQQYQYNLTSQGLVDRLDAARFLLARREELPRFDYVLVDESQDYTSIELRLTAALARTPDHLVYVGDMNQVVYPSYFTWDKVRSAVWEVWQEAPPKTVELNYNYRNPRPVTEIANALLHMRQKRLTIDYEKCARSNQAMTPLPMRITTDLEGLSLIIRELATNIGSLGVVQDKEERWEIGGIEFQRLFTPQTVKGLEFNVVCLINFNQLYSDLARKGRSRLTPRQLFLEFNEVYVSTTRTRAQLVLIDIKPERDGLWTLPIFSQWLETLENPEEFVKIITARFKLKSREEWHSAAIDFENQKAFGSAGECWERAGTPERAAIAYERGERLEKALSLYMAVGDFHSGGRLSEQLGKLDRAADLYSKAGQFEKAAKCWSKLNEALKAASCYQTSARDTGSQRLWLEAGRHFRSAHLPQEAAACFESAEDWNEALSSWLALGSYLDAARCCRNLGNKKQASIYQARHLEENGEFQQAAEQWEAANDSAKAAVCWEEAGFLEKAQKIMGSIGNFLESGRLLKLMERHAQAAEHFGRAGAYGEAASCHELLGEWLEAASQWERAAAYDSAARCYEEARNWRKAAPLWLASRHPGRAAECYENSGDWLKAAPIRRGCRQFEAAARAYEKADAWILAGDTWARLRNVPQAESCYLKGGDEQRARYIRDLLDHRPQPSKAPAAPLPESSELTSWLWESHELYRSLRTLHGLVLGADQDHLGKNSLRTDLLQDLSRINALQIHPLADLCATLRLELAGRSDATADFWKATDVESPHGDPEKCDDLLCSHVAEIAQMYLCEKDQDILEEIQKNAKNYARLFAHFEEYEQAASLFERVGDSSSAARSYRYLGMHFEASEHFLRAGNKPEAAISLERERLHAQAALLWLDLGDYDRATENLHLLGENDLAQIYSSVQHQNQFAAAQDRKRLEARHAKKLAKSRTRVERLAQRERKTWLGTEDTTTGKKLLRALARFLKRVFGMRRPSPAPSGVSEKEIHHEPL